MCSSDLMEAENPTENLTYYNEEMEDCANGYAAYVLEQMEAAKQTCSDPVVLIEQRVDFSRWVEGGFGTADCIILDDGVVNVIDLKYGMTPVEVKNNSQAMLYALGVLNDYGMLYEFETFNLHIYQPRINNISTWAISRSELLQWSEYVRVRALACLDVNAPRIPSEAGCHWCKAKATCPALTAHVEKVIGAEFDDLTLPPVEQVNVKAILDNKKLIEQFLTAVEEYAFDTIESGKEVLGYKVVEAITHRRWKDNAQDAVRAALGDEIGRASCRERV